LFVGDDFREGERPGSVMGPRDRSFDSFNLSTDIHHPTDPKKRRKKKKRNKKERDEEDYESNKEKELEEEEIPIDEIEDEEEYDEGEALWVHFADYMESIEGLKAVANEEVEDGEIALESAVKDMLPVIFHLCASSSSLSFPLPHTLGGALTSLTRMCNYQGSVYVRLGACASLLHVVHHLFLSSPLSDEMIVNIEERTHHQDQIKALCKSLYIISKANPLLFLDASSDHPSSSPYHVMVEFLSTLSQPSNTNKSSNKLTTTTMMDFPPPITHPWSIETITYLLGTFKQILTFVYGEEDEEEDGSEIDILVLSQELLPLISSLLIICHEAPFEDAEEEEEEEEIRIETIFAFSSSLSYKTSSSDETDQNMKKKKKKEKVPNPLLPQILIQATSILRLLLLPPRHITPPSSKLVKELGIIGLMGGMYNHYPRFLLFLFLLIFDYHHFQKLEMRNFFIIFFEFWGSLV